jgi:hypothetical protein
MDMFISLNLCPDSLTLAKQSGRDVCRLLLRASTSSERYQQKTWRAASEPHDPTSATPDSKFQYSQLAQQTAYFYYQ